MRAPGLPRYLGLLPTAAPGAPKPGVPLASSVVVRLLEFCITWCKTRVAGWAVQLHSKTMVSQKVIESDTRSFHKEGSENKDSVLVSRCLPISLWLFVKVLSFVSFVLAEGQLLELALGICFASAADCALLAEKASVEAIADRGPQMFNIVQPRFRPTVLVFGLRTGQESTAAIACPRRQYRRRV